VWLEKGSHVELIYNNLLGIFEINKLDFKFIDVEEVKYKKVFLLILFVVKYYILTQKIFIQLY
jgi:hypothetical protein